MNNPVNNAPVLIFSLVLTLLAISAVAARDDALAANYPELARLHNAHGLVQSALFNAMADINADPQTRATRLQTRQQIDQINNLDRHDHMSMGHGGNAMPMSMDKTGPYGELERQARVQLAALLRGDHGPDAAAGTLENSEVLPLPARQVLARGRRFERSLFDIYADDITSVAQKRAAVAAAIEAYYSGDARYAVAAAPKQPELYLAHPYANAASTAFPALSGLLWTNQWLQLAALEALAVGQLDPRFQGKVPLTLERYWNKVGSDTGMTMFPVPVEMPSVPAIAPSLYSEVPQAAVIIDNLHMLETALADLIAYPDLVQRAELLQQVVAQFTSASDHVADEMSYLLSALRGGIFNQGGPAIGELTGSERNRSRAAMNMQHSMIMSAPQ